MGKKSGTKKRRQQQQQRGYATTNIPAKPVTTAKPNGSSAEAKSRSQYMPATTSVSSTTDNGCISSQTHQELLNLLGKLDDEDHDWLLKQQQESKRQSTSYLTPARLYRKLYSIHDTLDQLGFAFEHVEKVVTALGRDITLESALDWLCLHLKTQDLPPLLTEGSVREQETSVSGGTATTTTSSSLTVLRPTPVVESDTASTSNHIDEKLPEEHPLPNPAIAKPPKKKETNDKSQTSSPEEKDDTKAWILQQYQYEEEEEYDEEDVLPMMTTMNTVDEQPEVEMPPSNGSNKEQMDKQQQQEHSITAKDDFVVDPNQARLQELEEQLRQQEADLKDEAANYMRSKHEIKELQASAKKLRKQVQGLQKKMKKNRAAEAEATKNDENRNGNSSDDAELGQDEGDVLGVFQEDDEGGGLFGMFDQDESVESKPRNRENKGEAETDDKEEGPPPSDPVVPKGSVPKGWSGKTPKTILEEWCRKEKIRRPQFFKLPKLNGARIRVDVTPAALTMETDNYMGSYLDAQEYLATKALYELNQDLPLYRLFPPFYRELWCSWTESAQTEKNAQKQQEHDAIKEKVERLMDCVQKPKGTDDLKEKVDFSSNSRKNGDAVAPVVADCWEDDKEADVDVLVDNRWEATDTASGDGSRNESVLDKNVSSSSSTSRSGDNLKAMFMKRQKIPQYQEMLEARSALPMYSYRDQVLGTIRNNPVTVLCAETGAGKTTQCPQFILEEAFLKGIGDKVNVICTQPRRVAATSVAERVSDEMGERSIGGTVGYQIRLEAKRSSSTRLLFCTTGVVLRRLQDDPLLNGVTHIVVDEVHERQYQVDCLLVMLRQLLHNRRPDLKVVLMSATLDAKLFCSFFNGAPVINVPGRTFPVANYFLEDVLDGTDHIIEEGSRYALRENRNRETATIDITTRGGEKRKEVHALSADGVHLADVSDDYPNHKMTTRRSMDRVNEEIINYELIEDILRLLLVEPEKNEVLVPPKGSHISDGSVLIFLPGKGEILSLTNSLQANRVLGNKDRFEIIPLHSTLSPQDQRRAFTKPKKGCRKIILSTNIAETSVTIPSVVCVIDAGRVREVRVDKRTSTSKLVTDWCSRASAKQRGGRSGRVQPGICLKLYSSKTATYTMKEASQPEIRRVPLEDVCLSILAGSFADNCMSFLSQTPQPPAEEAVKSALRILHEVGAIKFEETLNKSKPSEKLTPLGWHISKLPVDVRLAKMLIYGTIFNCVDPVLTVAASLSCKSPFVAFVNEALQAKAKHKLFAHPQSDFMTLCNVFEAYNEAQTKGVSHARRFCSDNFLSYSALREMYDTRRHFIELLAGIGFLKSAKSGTSNGGRGAKFKWTQQSLSISSYNANKDNHDVVHSIICAGLYPHVGHLIPTASGIGERPLWHRKERLHFHSSSVNSMLKTTNRYPTSWIVFHEKFGTQNRIYVSTTCFVHPFAILVFGGDLIVKHTERKVILDDWIELPLAAQTGVMFREVRKQLEHILQGFLDTKLSSPLSSEGRAKDMIDGIVRLLSTDPSREITK